MTWADSVPNLLIGLREGLEAGLVVTILLAAVRKTSAAASTEGEPERTVSTAPVWLGVLGAVTLAGSFAAVLTFSVSVLTSADQEAVGGLLSVLAVILVTGMIFWMRRTAATLSAHLKGEVARAAAIGAGALTLTAFLSVGREGLETTLFLWTAAKASGQTSGPLVGAAIGIAAAVLLCWLLYKRAVRINIGVFFNRTAILLIVIAAGVLAYGLGDLQDANYLPGHAWVAFDLTAHIDPGSWWASIVTGLTELSPKMTVLQVTAWLAYLVVVIPLFVSAGRSSAVKAPATVPRASVPTAVGGGSTPPSGPPVSEPPVPVPSGPGNPKDLSSTNGPGVPGAPTGPSPWARLAGRRPWVVAGVVVAVPVLAAGVTIAALPAAAASAATVTVTNNSGLAGEINLDDAGGAVIAEIETIGPGTSAPMVATLGNGSYTFHCLMGSRAATSSPTVTVSAGSGTGSGAGSAPVAVKPVTVADLTAPNKRYQAYAATQLDALAKAVAGLEADLRAGNTAKAKQDWLAAQLDWERVGASYDSFGDLGLAVDGLPDGLPNGVTDKGFTGLHRLEYGLWHGQGAKELLPVAQVLAKNVTKVQDNLTSDDLAGDPTQLPIRAHEIIEDALRDHLSAIDDEGAGAAYPMTYADTQVDRVVLGYLAPLLSQRDPGLVATADRELATLDAALLATQAGGRWPTLATVTLDQRQHVDAAIGGLLETLASVPDLLEVPPAHG